MTPTISTPESVWHEIEAEHDDIEETIKRSLERHERWLKAGGVERWIRDERFRDEW
jgi:hypothetical protein